MRAALLAAALSVLLFAERASAQDAEACLAAHVSVQEKRLAGDLVGARTAAATCSAAHCPALPRGDCERWAGDIDREIPTLTLEIKNPPDGAALELTVDGVVEPYDQAVLLNPGDHSVALRAGDKVENRSVRMAKGQKETLVVDFADPNKGIRPGVSPGGRAPNFIGPVVVGSVGIAALIAFGVVGGLGMAEYNDLEDTCGGSCTPDQVSAVDTKFLAADIALGLGCAAVAAAVVWIAVEVSSANDVSAPVEANGSGLTILF